MLAAHPPADTDAADVGEWWGRAVEAAVRLLAGRPTPEGARLAALVPDACPPERAAGLHHRAQVALGPAPAAEEIDQVLPAAGMDEAGCRDELLASWLRVWAWSPVLPVPLLAGFAPLLAALRQWGPAGPPDPWTAARPHSRHHTNVAVGDLRELAAGAGPLAVAALVSAPEAGAAAGYAIVLQRLVAAAPAAWTDDVPHVLAVLARPELAAFYLAAVNAARHPGAFPTGVAKAALAALTLSRALPAPVSQVPDAAEFAGRAWSGLLSFVWRTGTGLGGDQSAVLNHLHFLAEPLTRPAPPPPVGALATPPPGTAGLADDRVGAQEPK
ncbi:hypothetical protein ACIRPQ_34615 [Streptomyces sp. NPDC101213]|uniref:hypothetical protein n=1 Tax=Streptomyces sp. NPDC101213 TaxID=3366130 RepID=UPI00380E4CB6